MRKNETTYHVGIPYTRKQQEKLKRFCGRNNLTVCRFIADAITNEIRERLDDLPPEEKLSLEKLFMEIDEGIKRSKL